MRSELWMVEAECFGEDRNGDESSDLAKVSGCQQLLRGQRVGSTPQGHVVERGEVTFGKGAADLMVGPVGPPCHRSLRLRERGCLGWYGHGEFFVFEEAATRP